MNRRQLIMVVVALLVIVLGVMGLRSLTNMKPPERKAPVLTQAKTVKTRRVENQQVSSRIELTGRLEAKDKIELFAEVGGVLHAGARPFREGNRFSKGEALLVIDADEARLNLLAQKSSLLNQITLILPDLKLDYPEGYPNWLNYVDNFDPEKPIVPLPEPGTDAERYFISAKNLYNLYYAIRSQETRIQKYTIRAPFSGVVSASEINEGTLVRVGQKLGEFFNPYVFELEAAVNLKDVTFIKEGNKVALVSNDIGGKWEGQVRRISNSVDPNTQTVKIYIDVRGNDLKEGMYLAGDLSGKGIDDVIEFDRKLLINQTSVYVVRDSMLALQPIEPIKFTTSTVIARGLSDGTEMVDESLIGAFEGMKVKTY